MKELNGMTINERLFALKVMDAFDEAIKLKDINSAIKILQECGLSHSSALETITSIFKNPKHYGF